MKIENLSPYRITHGIGRTALGQETLVVYAKGGFCFGEHGQLSRSDEISAFVEADEFTAEAGKSSLRFAAETCPVKPWVDVYVCGSLQFPEPKTVIDCSLQVGTRYLKRVRVWGSRVWRKDRSNQLSASAPEPFTSVPLHWEKSFNGVSSRDSKIFEPRNPSGVGLYNPDDADGRPLPNFEAPDAPTALGAPSAPVGFGAVSPHWAPRARYAGTYDQAWREKRAPLPPADFNPRFFNVAPEDQQLPHYPVGETLSLTNMTPNGQVSFTVPAFTLPVTFADSGCLVEREARPDTIVIDLDQRMLIVRAALEYVPRQTVMDVASAVVGAISKGRRRALETAKTYAKLRECGRAVRA